MKLPPDIVLLQLKHSPDLAGPTAQYFATLKVEIHLTFRTAGMAPLTLFVGIVAKHNE